MPRKKLPRIQETLTMANVIQHDDPDAKQYIEEFFNTPEKVLLELGCGRGEYTVGLSQLNPNAHCLGVDIQGERIWHGAKYAVENNNDNIRFFRAPIRFILDYVPEHSVDEIWIPFPDPFPRKKSARKRLTSPRFLDMYKKILKPGGVINLKTDNEALYFYSKETVEAYGATVQQFIENVYADITPEYKKEVIESPLFVLSSPQVSSSAPEALTRIHTNFEKKFVRQEKKIFYLRFTL